MGLIVLTGGARSGKSVLAVRAAGESAREVVFVATAEDGRDSEFSERIARHRAARPPDWRVVEEPVELAAALDTAPDDACVVVDCLALWVSNLVERGLADGAVVDAARRAAGRAVRRDGPTLVVTNEVGLGIVPEQPLARRYRDLLGVVNAEWAARADEALLVVAGRALRLDPWDGLA
jgi:adenosylcobinamide kinase / adenosylcobinamide-phosphate guanylyltransferase